MEGLVIESWGPSTRNPEYAKAFETLLMRLKQFGLPSIQVFVVSSRLITVFPNINDREILFDGEPIPLINCETEAIRLRIGKGVAKLRESPSASKGGNRYKRILIYNPLINSSTWEQLATSNVQRTNNAIVDVVPTSDPVLFDQQVDMIELYIEDAPKGQPEPNRSAKQVNLIERDPLVKAWVLQEANGICELCDSPSPFLKSNGKPYLEVHHINHLANGGSDTISNAIAVCPNCHRALHYSSKRDELTENSIIKIERLVRECD
jgi:5-methylcytosine-specific restriction protein A